MEEKDVRELSMKELEGVAGGVGGSPTKLPPKPGFEVYQIQRGDTLGKIARRHSTTVEVIKAANHMIRSEVDIRTGYYIYVPER